MYYRLILTSISFCLIPAIIFSQSIFSDNFETGSLNSNWTVNTNIEGDFGNIEVISGDGLNNSFGVRLGKSQNSELVTINALDLNLDLSGFTQVELSFYILDLNDFDNIQDGLYMSDNGGGTFVKVLDFKPNEWCDNVYGQFPPIDIDQLAGRNGLSLTSNFIIRFQQAGTNSFNGSGTGNPDGFLIDEVNVYDPGLIYSKLPFEDNFDDNSFKDSWAWNFAENTVITNLQNEFTSTANSVGVGSESGIDGTPGAFMGKRCNSPYTVNALDLHLDLSEESDVEMTFWINDLNDQTNLDDGLFFSDNGGETFIKVLDFKPEEWCDNVYGQFPPIDVDKLVFEHGLVLSSTFVIRFQQAGTNSFNGSGTGNPDGFLIDEVNVYDPGLTYSKLPFEDNFDNNSFKDSWAWNFAENTVATNLQNEFTSTANLVGVGNESGIDGTPGAFLGKRCNSPYTVNALDLHLDLSEESDVEMTFWIYDLNDQTNIDDGLFFSDNGGETFVKVLDFKPEEWCDNVYGQFPPIDIDKLVDKHGLVLSSTFVIRFQQAGTNSFNGSGTGNPDGFLIDEVRVYDPGLTYSKLPFEDNFDNNSFKDSWAWNFADSTVAITLDNSFTSPMNAVGIGPNDGLDQTPGVYIGKRCNSPFTVNALDLHLNLSDFKNITLDFWIYDNGEFTDVVDGIYFSDNAGNSFVKVVDFDFNSIPDFQYVQFPTISVDSLASISNLTLSESFVIRFQQGSTNSFNGSGTGNPDGILLDLVRVSGDDVVSTKQVEKQLNINLYPNPVKEIINLNYLGAKILSFEIFDSFGRVQSRGTLNNNIDAGHLKPGVYFIRLMGQNNEMTSLRFVKQ